MKDDHPRNRRWGWPQVVLVAILVILAVVSAGCFQKTRAGGQDFQGKNPKDRRPPLYERELSQVLVYFLTQDGTYLVPVTVTFNPTREVSKIAVEKLLAGPQADGLKGVMPEGVKLRDVYLLDNQQTIYVDLTGEFLHMQDSKQAEMAVKALALTLTNLDNIRFVQILVEGQSVPDIQGIKIDNPLSRPDHINSWLKSPDQKGVQVYFSGVNARFLVPLTVTLPPGVGENDLPRAAVLALLAGPPPDSGLIRTIWPGTRLLDLKIENGLATVNFSQEVTGYGGGTTAETILLDSLLFTLTQFPEIDRVQILIEGQKREYLPEGSPIDKPLEAPEQLNFVKP